ncbi:IPTL-CTERM sorting domain-containing protein [Candidatus Bipolaricaulota bacterium]|nr:IPTL-CTERM sorting domain-containing protein [Candidatus Bipolaricaulota bacterium]
MFTRHNNSKLVIVGIAMLAFVGSVGMSLFATSGNGGVKYIGIEPGGAVSYYVYKVTDPDKVHSLRLYYLKGVDKKGNEIWSLGDGNCTWGTTHCGSNEGKCKINQGKAKERDHLIMIYDCQKSAGNFDSSWRVKKGSPNQDPGLAFIGPSEIKGAPTLTEWGLIALGILLAGSLAWMIRRRVITRPTGA